MNIAFLALAILLSAAVAAGQAISSTVEIVTTYSQNGKFYLKSVPYDNEEPSLRGKTSVYKKGVAAPIYVLERAFDSPGFAGNNLFLSNDGEVIIYVIGWGADETKEAMRSVTVYKRGKLFKSFTETEITGCDKNRERCSLVYSNFEEVIDKRKSNWGTASYRKVLKAGVDEKERFLSDFSVFSFDDTVYLTDSRKNIHLFDLKEGGRVGSDSFDNVFERIKTKGRLHKTETQRFDAPLYPDFPRLKNGVASESGLANHIGMKTFDLSDKKDEQFKRYSLKVSGYISRDGAFEMEELEADDELPKEKIGEFFRANKFDASPVPAAFEKWYVGEQYFFFRKRDERLARREKQQEIIARRQELEKRLTLERIDGVYIPANLGECFAELDRLLTEIDKREMRALPKREEMIRYHMGLGTWMRNSWGLWRGSRLQKYFNGKGVKHPESMSSVVLYLYHDWLNGRKEAWREWEKNPNGAGLNN